MKLDTELQFLVGTLTYRSPEPVVPAVRDDRAGEDAEEAIIDPRQLNSFPQLLLTAAQLLLMFAGPAASSSLVARPAGERVKPVKDFSKNYN